MKTAAASFLATFEIICCTFLLYYLVTLAHRKHGDKLVNESQLDIFLRHLLKARKFEIEAIEDDTSCKIRPAADVINKF